MDFVADYVELELERVRVVSRIANSGFMMSGDKADMEDLKVRRHANLTQKIGPLLKDKNLTFLDPVDRAVLAEIDFFRTCVLFDYRVMGLPEELKQQGVKLQKGDLTNINNIPAAILATRLKRDSLSHLGTHPKFMRSLYQIDKKLATELLTFSEGEVDKPSRFDLGFEAIAQMRKDIRDELGFETDARMMVGIRQMESILKQVQAQSIGLSERLGAAMVGFRTDYVRTAGNAPPQKG